MVCEGGVGLFYFFGGDETDRAGLGGGCIPRRCTPASTGAPGRAAHHRQQGRPCQTRRTDTHARTLDTLHPIPDRPRRADRTGGGRWRVQCLYVACAMFLYACTFNLGLDNAYDRGETFRTQRTPPALHFQCRGCWIIDCYRFCDRRGKRFSFSSGESGAAAGSVGVRRTSVTRRRAVRVTTPSYSPREK